MLSHRQSYANVFGSKASVRADSEGYELSSHEDLLERQELDDVQKALRKEVAIFERRERLLLDFKVHTSFKTELKCHGIDSSNNLVEMSAIFQCREYHKSL